MKFSLEWLGRYVDLSGVDTRELVQRVTISVAEVETAESFGGGLKELRVARIVEAAPHPRADRLTVCQVEDGEGLRTIVCGAPNARAGLVTALAPPGLKIGDLKIKVAKIRGVESTGMLCSPAELGLTDDGDGICELPEDLEPGTPLGEVVAIEDTVFEVDNKSLTHRPDLWGYVGMARELAAWLGRPLTLPPEEIELGPDDPPVIEVASPEACPRYTALSLLVPAIDPAPLWMQVLLHRSGVRPISNVVDLTNFVMLEWGNPLHAFDARAIRGHRIEVRTARPGEMVETLDRTRRVLGPDDLLICDGERPVALAGIMGLANSEIGIDTREVILEAACFRADGVRRTATRLKLRTEASARFEKSLDPELPPRAARRFARLLLDTVPGSRIASRLADACAPLPESPVIPLSTTYVSQRLGIELSREDVAAKLSSLEFGVERAEGEDGLAVTVPSFRATKDISIPEDLVEEVGRLHGYDNIPPVHPSAPLPQPYRHPARTFHRRVRYALSLICGLNEIQSYSFDPEPLLGRIGHPEEPRIRVNNPISAEATHLRVHLLPGLLGAFERNLKAFAEQRLYEIGRVFHEVEGEIPRQPYLLGLLLSRQEGTDWVADQREAVVRLKGIVAELGLRLRLSLHFDRLPNPLPWLHPVRSAAVCLSDGTVVGEIGALHPEVCEELGHGPHTAVAEILLDPLQAAAELSVYRPISRYPSVPFDLSIIVPESVLHGDVMAVIREVAPPDLQEIDYVMGFRGEPIPEGNKSLTYRLLFQSDERTLEMEEVRQTVDALVRVLGEKVGAWIRI